MLQELQISVEQKEILDRLSSWGGVLQLSFFSNANGIAVPEVEHRQAVQLAMLKLQAEAEAYADRASVTHNFERSKFFSVKIDEAAALTLVPVKIDLRQFLGTQYDFQRKGLLTRGNRTFLNDLFFFADVEKQENIVPYSDSDDGIGNGLAYAFSDPPYGLFFHDGRAIKKPTRYEVGVLFNELLEKVLCISQDADIYQWPTNWSNYFDAGNEWWGSFLWSISSHADNEIIVITASTTD